GLRQRTDGTYTAWVETPQYLQAVLANRPGSVTAKILGSSGVAPRVINVLSAPCPGGFAAGTCKQVAGGIDVGSFAGATGQYIDPILGGGLDGIPDLEFAQIAAPATNRGNQFNGRIDFDPTTKDFIALSMYFTHLYDLGSDTSTGSRPMADVNFSPLNTAVTVTYTRTLSATLLNEARANLTRFAANQVTSNAGVVDWGIPRLEVQGYPIPRLYFGAAQGEATPGIFAQNTYEFRDTLSKVAGNHGLKFGIEIRREQDNNTFVGASRPDFVFNGLWNLANSAPIFEAIAANPVTGGVAISQRYLRTPYDGLFVQDDWKVRPNLTLNIGLRWEYFSPPYQKGGTIGNIFFGSQGLSDSSIIPVHQLYESEYKNFAPRFGFAWSPHGSTNLVVRGGFGIFYDRIPEALFAQALANPPGAASYGICCGSSTNPFVGGSILYETGTSNSPFSYPANPKLAQGINPTTGSPNGGAVEIYGAQYHMPNPMVYVYSFGIEYKLPWKIALDLGYSGSEGHHLVRLVNQNYLYPNNNNLNGSAAFTAVYIPQPDDNSNYNAGLVTLRRNYDHGLQFIFNYRWSKSLDNSSYEGPGFVTNQTYPQNNRLEWGPSDFDVRQLYNLATVWDIPAPSRFHGFWKSALGGWQLAPVITWHTGFPWTPVIGQSVETPGGPSLSPIRPTVYLGGAGMSQSNDALMTGRNFPNTCNNANAGACFFNITAGGPPGIGRNSFRGPHFFQTDFSFAKNTRLPFFFGETSNLELRANFFNIFNQLNLQPFSFSGGGTHPDDPFFGISPGALAGRVVELQAKFSF
ncbi:MAG TPA: TonB-dependent receptor, partial [Bryobacteraceae bacterium]|nr:TonB-dependent receptor [Bryobacteraceae bacterium]